MGGCAAGARASKRQEGLSFFPPPRRPATTPARPDPAGTRRWRARSSSRSFGSSAWPEEKLAKGATATTPASWGHHSKTLFDDDESPLLVVEEILRSTARRQVWVAISQTLIVPSAEPDTRSVVFFFRVSSKKRDATAASWPRKAASRAPEARPSVWTSPSTRPAAMVFALPKATAVAATLSFHFRRQTPRARSQALTTPPASVDARRSPSGDCARATTASS
mmetsp:Transcript_10258/g.33888  ORF Transcript_10258/g.33888 Transcript_10258/m.33888 type:complete len:222 (+) Transcript_10258:1341-2006(+)